MVFAADPNQASSGQRRGCSTSSIDNYNMALMQLPSVLSAPTLMRHFYAYNPLSAALIRVEMNDDMGVVVE